MEDLTNLQSSLADADHKQIDSQQIKDATKKTVPSLSALFDIDPLLNGCDNQPTSGAFLKNYALKRAVAIEQEQPDGSWKVDGEKPSKLERSMIVVPEWMKEGG